MSSDKPYKNTSDSKFYHHNKPVTIASYVKYIMLVSYIVGIRKICLYVSQVAPLGILHYIVPSLQSHPCIFTAFAFIKFTELPM